jgi:hypothetical protein
MGQRQVPITQVGLRKSGDRIGKRLAGVIGRAVVRDDDLRRYPAVAEVFGACGEARRDAASLVIGRKN